MKNFKLKRLLGLAFIGGFSALSASTAFAAAGADISNTATLTFDVGGTPTVLESSEAGNSTTGGGNGTATVFKEDRLINFTVAEVGTATETVTAGATEQVQTFTVTNNGNDAQDFLLAALQQADGVADPFGGANDSFNPSSVEVFVETATAGFAAADDTNIFIDELAAGASATVYIVATIPAGTPDASVGVMTLVAQIAAGGTASADDSVAANAGAAIMGDDNSNVSPVGTYNNGVTTTGAVAAATNADDPTTVEVVFNDPTGDSNSAAGADAAQDGQHSDSDSYTVQAATLSVSKNAAILWDPVNGNTSPKAIPGAYMTYTIVVTNSGAASGDLTSMADTLSASLAIDPDFVDGSAAAGANAAAILATTTYGAGESFDVAHGGVGNVRADPVSCTATADADGCDSTLAAGGVIGLTFANLMPAEDIAPVGAGTEDYAAGELKAGETVTITFNAIVQ